MNKKTKLIAALMAVAMCISFAACGGSQGNSSAAIDYSLGLTTDGKYSGYNIKDYVTLGEYTGLQFPAETVAISEADVQAQIDSLLSSYSTGEQLTDRAVADKDIVNIDYTGYIDGVAFENGSTNGAGTDVTIGTTQYIDDFIDQLIGHMPGETFDIEVTFPDPYTNNPDMAGKDATFTITINYITAVTYPELTDEFVTTNLLSTYGYLSVADMREKITKDLLDTQVSGYILETAMENATVSEVPEKLVENEFTLIVKECKYQALQYGVDISVLLSYNYGVSDEETLRSTYKDYFTQQVQYNMLMQAIAEDAGLIATDEECKQYFTDNDLGITYDDAVKNYGKGYIARAVTFEKVTAYLIEQNPTNNVAPTADTATDTNAAN